MNVIWIMADSLRHDHIGANGNEWIKTPNLDRFAAQSMVFERSFQLSFPTIPTRTDIFTGRYTFPRRPWGPLEPDDTAAAQRFRKLGMRTQLIFDTYHLKNITAGLSGVNFDRRRISSCKDHVAGGRVN